MFVVFRRLCINKSSHASLCREYFRQTVAIQLGMPFLKSTKQGPLKYLLCWGGDGGGIADKLLTCHAIKNRVIC